VETRKLTTTIAVSVTALSLLAVGGAMWTPAARSGNPSLGAITITPDTGLTDGQTVQVSGSAFQKDRELRIIECGPLSDARPPVYALCSSYSVEVTSDDNGAFAAQDFVISTTIVGARREHGHNVPATYDCLPANDCHLHVFAPVSGLASANTDISFGS